MNHIDCGIGNSYNEFIQKYFITMTEKILMRIDITKGGICR